ncbi:type IV conjugative transfer system coupling protein TraD [Aeromonas dhakensis]|uniref:type IV conjugative transfer system coupling protein TraD n=1 Tax=Aeromonas dhakensis TaxID=196024 RepID=UPI001BFC7FE0|nr:type IV conjugative transfer system coupling protein TraD [Aeromonas dhakensis]HDT5888984.1 type IV conjugative transfer system coupling protein TraD [Aeromonas dhakensis]HDT5894405.1 type IV conjugative transfer system coupling protein TraD [Aeromonas hydrophila subsp. hydrophila]HEB4980239.1 type IV conjugative transfer system coupling protein TraD [Aeromonas dhakensis]
MSLNTRNVTQGGQVAFMRLRMFLQINNIMTYWLIMAFVVLTIAVLFFRVSTQNIMNGTIYWFSTTLAPLHGRMMNPPTYTIHYYDQELLYTTKQILVDAYTIYCGQLLKNELIIAASVSGAMVFLGGILFLFYLGLAGKRQSTDEITGGRTLNDNPKQVARMMRRKKQASDIKIDSLPIKKDSEIQNFAMHGTVGSGKSTLMRKFLDQCRQRGDMVIIYDKGCTFVEEYYQEGRDIILNPLDSRCANWDMWEECQTLPDLEAAATTLIPMGSSEDPFWQGSARTIFAEGAHRLRGEKGRSYNLFLRTLLAITLDKLREFLAGTPAANLVDGKIEKTAISIRSVLTNYVKAMRYLQGIERRGKPFTIRQWMQNARDDGNNGWLFITSNQKHHESLKPLISMWLSIAANSLLSMGENRYRRVWFFYDELPSLHKLPSLPFVIAEARKFGGCFALGFQSYSQLEEIYGGKFAEAMYDLLNTKYFFRSPSAAVAKFVEEDIGETVRKKFSEQTSFGADQVRDGISFGKDEERVSIVSYTDVQMLEDLECFVTLPGNYPVVRMALKFVKKAKIAEALPDRDIQSSLDPEVDELVTQRLNETGKVFDGIQPGVIAQVVATTLAAEPQSAASQPADSAQATDANPQTAAAQVPPAGRDQEITMRSPLPQGVDENGVCYDEALYEEYLKSQDSRQKNARLEEVNINHHHQEPGGDEPEFY